MSTYGQSSMNSVISKVLRFGVVLSGTVIALGTMLLAAASGTQDTGIFLAYSPAQVPHGGFDPSLVSVAQGVLLLNPYSIIEVGVLILLATPVARVICSALLFATEGDRTYVYITMGVLLLLLFSMLVTPFIPGFNG